jgi:uncharacterized protein involved in exopolysaccharide biosynthesis
MTAGAHTPVVPDDASLRALWWELRTHRRFLATIIGLTVAVAMAWALIRPRVYTSRASFLPEQSNGIRPGLGALASQIGLNLNLDQTGQSPAFYAALLQTPELLGEVASVTYHVDSPADSGNLAHVLHVKAKTPALERDAVVRRLMRIVDIRVDQATDMVRIFVTTAHPELSEQVAATLLEQVNHFNIERRRTRASAERQFSERQRKQAGDEMEDAEAQVQQFLEANRNYTGSPALLRRYERLRREATIRQQTYTTLEQAYEQARLDEVRNTPVITVVETPDLPAQPDSRRLVTWLAVSLLVGAVLAIVATVFRDAQPGLFGWTSLHRNDAGAPSSTT